MVKNNKNVKKKVKKVENKAKDLHPIEKAFNLALITGSFLCSFIFLSGGITGNTILDTTVKSSNILAGLLFIVGIVASFFSLKEESKNYSSGSPS